MGNIEIIVSDITKLQVDAIVNAANESLLGGGGVDGAIHQAAGPKLLDACKRLNGCETGEAKLTAGFELPATYIIHTVGPIWKDGSHNETVLLRACYTNTFKLAHQHNIRSLAFPAISTGAYGFPKKLAAEIAIIAFMTWKNSFETIVACLYSEEDKALYEELYKKFI